MKNIIDLKFVSYLLMGLTLLFLFNYHLMTALIGGMVIFLIVNKLYDLIGTKVHSKLAHKVTLLIISIFTVGTLSLIGIGVYNALHFGQSNFENLINDVLTVLQQIKVYLPEGLLEYVPQDLLALKSHVAEILKKSAPEMISVTSSSVKGVLHVIIGMLIGGVVAFSFLNTTQKQEYGSFTKELLARITLFTQIFQKVIFAQVKISAINTILTAIYLLIILPIQGINMPYAKTLVILTFLFGLLPVIGNLVTNALIVLLSLMVSFGVAIGSLIFLIVIHKLEYYINAKIIGEQIKTSIWEMLIVIIVMESVFGVVGAVLGSVVYGYIKEELRVNYLV
ncbi:AI-2E family transporter [archaeon]|nr:AI-2E family transporter [archaeon]